MPEPDVLPTLLAAAALALVHLLAGGFRALHVVPRSRWLSLAEGVSVAYVFIHILPELSAGQDAVQATGLLGALEHHVYLVALLGLAVFYGLERSARRSRQQRRATGEEDTPNPGVFWIHIGASYDGRIAQVYHTRACVPTALHPTRERDC